MYHLIQLSCFALLYSIIVTDLNYVEMKMSAQVHSLLFNERRGNPITTGQCTADTEDSKSYLITTGIFTIEIKYLDYSTISFELLYQIRPSQYQLPQRCNFVRLNLDIEKSTVPVSS